MVPYAMVLFCSKSLKKIGKKDVKPKSYFCFPFFWETNGNQPLSLIQLLLFFNFFFLFTSLNHGNVKEESLLVKRSPNSGISSKRKAQETTSSVLSGVGHHHSANHTNSWLSEMLMKNLCSKTLSDQGYRSQPSAFHAESYYKETFVMTMMMNNLIFLFGFPVLQESLTLNALAQGQHPAVSLMASHSPELDCTFQVPLTSQIGRK